MRDYLKEFSGDVIGDFLVDNDITEILKESNSSATALADDGPPTFYPSLADYKKETNRWIKSLQNDLGWKVVQYILSKGAMDPDEDYTMSHRALHPISHGQVKKYKNTMREVLDTLGWTVIKWMGVDKNQQLAGPPTAAGISAQKNTEIEAAESEKFEGGRPRLHKADKGGKELTYEKYSPLSKDWWSDELRELITEGGAYGHMAHPFDDKDLTFKDLKNIIEMGLGGQLNREDNVTEKLDGQNLMISWRA
jgi:hypothetical protein